MNITIIICGSSVPYLMNGHSDHEERASYLNALDAKEGMKVSFHNVILWADYSTPVNSHVYHFQDGNWGYSLSTSPVTARS